MTNPFKNDNFLLRFKDWILLLIALFGLLGYIGKGFSVQTKIEATASDLAEHKRKYDALLDKHETQIAVIDARFQQIMDALKDIRRGQRER